MAGLTEKVFIRDRTPRYRWFEHFKHSQTTKERNRNRKHGQARGQHSTKLPFRRRSTRRKGQSCRGDWKWRCCYHWCSGSIQYVPNHLIMRSVLIILQALAVPINTSPAGSNTQNSRPLVKFSSFPSTMFLCKPIVPYPTFVFATTATLYSFIVHFLTRKQHEGMGQVSRQRRHLRYSLAR